MIDMNVNYADIFAEKVKNNPLKYPDSIHKMIKRYEKWKKRDDIFFDLTKANAMLVFTETFYKHIKGEWAGKPLILPIKGRKTCTFLVLAFQETEMVSMLIKPLVKISRFKNI